MQILLLATEETPKLEPLGEAVAAALIPVAGRPVMAIMLELLARAGHKHVLVSLYQRGGDIVSYFGKGLRWGMQIDYVTQREPWGSAGALRWAAPLLHETVLVLPADILLDLDVEAALAAHRASGGSLTLITAAPEARQLCRPVATDALNRVRSMSEAAASAEQSEFTGAFICEPHVLHHIPVRAVSDVYTQFVPAALVAGEQVYAYRTGGYWNPLDTFRQHAEAQRVFLYSAYQPDGELPQSIAGLPKVRHPSIDGHQICPGIWVGPNHSIHPSARLAPPVYIGEGCRIGSDVELGPEAVIEPNVIIDDQATVRYSTIFKRSYIGRLVNIDRRVVSDARIIDVQTSESVEIVDRFLISTLSSPKLREKQLVRIVSGLVALVLIGVTIPVWLVIAAILAVSAGGRIFTHVPRVGRRAAGSRLLHESHQLNLLAFRTQRVDGTWYAFGRWMRRWGVDRLPELWNVVRGDIALVGTKPLSPSEAAALHEEWHQAQYPSGMTGLWYVQTPRLVALDDLLISDAYYVATRSWRADMMIVVRTPKVWFQQRFLQSRQPTDAREYYGRIDKASGI